MNSPRSELFIRRALWVNAAFSLCTGVSMVVFPEELAQGLSDGAVPPLAFAIVGAALLPFATAVAFTAQRRQLAPSLVLAISVMDLGWVIGTVVLGLGWPGLLNAFGWTCAAAVALAVDGLCLWQLYGLRRLNLNVAPSPGEGQSIITAERVVPVTVERAWGIISDLNAYASYVPNLHYSRVLKGKGEGLVRECGDGNGRWTERACLWEDGKAYAFRVDTLAPDYPFPFKVLGGRWEVSSHVEGARIGMRFDATMKGGVVGDVLFSAILAPQFRASLEKLLDNWEAAMRSPEKQG